MYSPKDAEELVKVCSACSTLRSCAANCCEVYVSDVIVYSFTVIFTKLSILYLYHRIFQSRTLFVLASLIGVLVLAYSAVLITFAFLKCFPSSKLWSSKPEAMWIPTRPAYITLA